MKKAILMDRDGTLIQEVGYLKMIEDMKFTPRATDALRIFHELGYLNIVITNQSAVARGLLSLKELNRIHKRLREFAAEEGAVVDSVFSCPHYPEGRVAPYNVECECRKPKPGLIHQARDRHRLDLSECWYVGDKVSDLELARNAGIRPVLVLTGYGTKTRDEWTEPVDTFANLYAFAVSLKAAEAAKSTNIVVESPAEAPAEAPPEASAEAPAAPGPAAEASEPAAPAEDASPGEEPSA